MCTFILEGLALFISRQPDTHRVFRYLYAQGWLINITPAAESNHNFLNILKLSIASLGVLFLIKHLPKIAKETELTAAG